jgi:hypothetical protein
MATSTPATPCLESILYLSSLLADQPRAIDRYIDYFGDATPEAFRSRTAWRQRRTA